MITKALGYVALFEGGTLWVFSPLNVFILSNAFCFLGVTVNYL